MTAKPLAPLHVCQRSFCLREPEFHPYLSVHLDSSRQFSTTLLHLSCLAIQDTETTVAVGLKGAHAKFCGKGHGLLVMDVSLCSPWSTTVNGNGTKKPQNLCFISSRFALACKRECRSSEVLRILHTARHKIGFTKLYATLDRRSAWELEHAPLDPLLQTPCPFIKTSSKNIGRPQRSKRGGEPQSKVFSDTELHTVFKPWDGLGEFPLSEIQIAKANRRPAETERVLACCRAPDGFFAMHNPLGERAEVRQA